MKQADRERVGAGTAESNDTTGTVEAEHQLLEVDLVMDAHTLEVMAINSAPLSTTKLKGPQKEGVCEFSFPSTHK